MGKVSPLLEVRGPPRDRGKEGRQERKIRILRASPGKGGTSGCQLECDNALHKHRYLRGGDLDRGGGQTTGKSQEGWTWGHKRMKSGTGLKHKTLQAVRRGHSFKEGRGRKEFAELQGIEMVHPHREEAFEKL